VRVRLKRRVWCQLFWFVQVSCPCTSRNTIFTYNGIRIIVSDSDILYILLTRIVSSHWRYAVSIIAKRARGV
jgi:hypothetical protein